MRGVTMHRPAPKLLTYSDFQLKCIFGCLYFAVVLAFLSALQAHLAGIGGYSNHAAVIKHELPPVFHRSTLTYEISGLTPCMSYLALELSPGLAYAIAKEAHTHYADDYFKHPVVVGIELHSPCGDLFNGSEKLVGRCLALVRPLHCHSYSVQVHLRHPHQVDRGTGSLLGANTSHFKRASSIDNDPMYYSNVRRRLDARNANTTSYNEDLKLWALTRNPKQLASYAVLQSVLIVLLLSLICFALCRIVSVSGVPLCLGPALVQTIAMVLQTRPLEAWNTGFPSYQTSLWRLSLPCSEIIAAAGAVMLPGDLMRDIDIVTRRYTDSKGWWQHASEWAFTIVQFAVASCMIVGYVVVYTFVCRHDTSIVGFATLSNKDNEWVYIFSTGFPLAIYYLWGAFRLYLLRGRVRKVPYSLCRTHCICYGFILLNTVVQILSGAFLGYFLGVFKALSPEGGDESAWLRLNQDYFWMLIPTEDYSGLLDCSFVSLFVVVSVLAFIPQHLRVTSPGRYLSYRRSMQSCNRQVTETSTFRPSFRSIITSFMTATSYNKLEIQPAPTIPALMAQPPSTTSLTLFDIRVFLHCAMQAGPLSSGQIPTSEMNSLVQAPDARYPQLDADLIPALERLSVQEVVSDATLDAHAAIMIWEPPEALGSFTRAAPRTVLVCFRGTSSGRNVCTDAQVRLVRLRENSGSAGERPLAESHLRSHARVHEGFQNALAAVADRVVTAIIRSGCSHVWLLGHSLGGAMATLLAPEVSVRHPCVLGVCTFGSPPVGNRSFVNLFRQSVTISIRVVNEDDPVPSSLPPLFGFQHAEELVRISPCGHIIVDPGFIEEALRRLVHRTTVIPFLPFYCCRFRHHAGRHLGTHYAESLRKAQNAELSAQQFEAERYLMPRDGSFGVLF